MVTGSVIVSGVSVTMVWTPVEGIANAIVSAPGLPFASRMAWRSDPAPESAVVVTVKVAAPAPVAASPRQADAATRPRAIRALVSMAASSWL